MFSLIPEFKPFWYKVFNAIMKRRTMANLAKDMDTWIEKRDQLSHKIDELKKQREFLLRSEVHLSIPFVTTIMCLCQCPDVEEVTTIDEDLDSISANIDYVQENIVELQNDLIVVEDTKSDGDTLEAHTIIASSSPRESKYLLEHLLDLVLNLVSFSMNLPAYAILIACTGSKSCSKRS